MTRDRDKQTDEVAITEDKLHAYQKQLAERERRIRDEERKFEKERADFVQLEREKEDLRLQLEQLGVERENQVAPAPDRAPTATTIPFPESPRHEYNESCEYTLKEAVNTIPVFDGNNITALQFSRACRRAREIVPPQAERTSVKLIITRLRGRAALAVEDELCDTVSSLCNRLKDVFEPRRSVDHFRGEMANIYMKSNKHVLDFL